MDDVFSCGETAWNLIHDRSYSLLRKKYTPFVQGNPATICSILFFVCGATSTGVWFAFISYVLYYHLSPNIHFLYYLSAYTLGSLPVLSLHKNYEQNISKRDFSKLPFRARMVFLSLCGIGFSVIFSIFSFSLLVTLLFILLLGISHGALLGGFSQLASVFPDPCNGALLLGVDLAGLIPFLLVCLIAICHGTVSVWGPILFIVPALFTLLGILSFLLLLRSSMATQYLDRGHGSASLRHNVEGLETLLSRSGGDDRGGGGNGGDDATSAANSYVSLSSFLSVSTSSHQNHYPQALAWGVVVFACTFCTFFMIPFFPLSHATSHYLPFFLFFIQHFADIVGREMLCGFVKSAVKRKVFMWAMVALRAVLIAGWIVEVLTRPFTTSVRGVLEGGAVMLSGLVGGAINPAVYMLAGLRISDDSRDSVKAIHCCMWCSVAGALAALVILNITSFIHPISQWGF